MELHLSRTGPEEHVSQILDHNMEEMPYLYGFTLSPKYGVFPAPFASSLRAPLWWGLETSKAWPGANTDNFVQGRVNGLSDVGVVLSSLLFKQASVYRSQTAGLKIQFSYKMLQPGYVPCLGMEPATFQCAGQCSNQLNHTSQGNFILFSTLSPYHQDFLDSV